MAVSKKSLENLKHIRKGQVLNPRGGQVHDKDIKALRNLTKDELKEVGSLILKNNVEALKAIGKDPGASALKTMVASVVVRVIQKGDMYALDLLLDRLIGKVKEEIQHTGLHAPQVIVTLPKNGREANDEKGG